MKTLTRDEAREQAKRLQSSPAIAPQSKEGRQEIVDCLMRNCDDAEHAERAMTQLIDTCKDPRNITAELAGAASSTRKSTQPLPGPCAECPEGDWIPCERNGYTGVRRCNCNRGVALIARDRAVWAEMESTRPKPANGAKLNDNWKAVDARMRRAAGEEI